MASGVKKSGKGLRFAARIQPRASKNQLMGWQNAALKIRVTSPPVEGEANRECIRFLAGVLGVSRSRIALVCGETGRNKTFEVTDMDEATFVEKIRLALHQPGS